MADIIGQETWTANGKAYVIKVTEPGATVTENAISITSPITIRRGDMNYEALEPILETQLFFTIRDNSKLFQTAIKGKDIGDIVLEFTEDGTTLFKGYIIPEFNKNLVYEENPTFNVTAYDGINGLKGFFYDQTGKQTIREQLYNITNKIGLSLPLNMFFESKELSALGSVEAPDSTRLRAENFMDEGSYYDALVTMCEFHNAQFFQREGEWYFMQRQLRGSVMKKYPTDAAGSAGTSTTVDYLYETTEDTLHREQTYLFDWPAKSRIESVHKLQNYGFKNGDFTQGSRYWNAISGSPVDDKWEIDTHEDYIEQEVGHTFRTTTASLDTIKVHIKFEVDINPSASGNGVISWGEVIAEDTQGNTRWLTDAGAWSASQAYLTHDIGTMTGGTTVDVTTAQASLIVPFDPTRITVRFTHFNGSEAVNPNQIIDATRFVEAWITHVTPDPEDDINRPEEFVYSQETGKLGEAVSHEFQIGDRSDNFIAPGVMEYFNGSSVWVPSNSWDIANRSYHEKRMLDRHDQVDERLGVFEASHKFGECPDLHNAIVYDDDGDGAGNVYVPTFVEKVYSRNAKVYTKTSSKQLLGATRIFAPAIYMVGDDDHFYTMEKDFTGETDTGLDLSSYSIIDIARNQVDGKIYGLSSDGTVYSWQSDGTGFATAFSTGFTDFTQISIDNANQHVVLSNHRAGTFNDFTYAYSLAGVQQWSWENRSGSSMLGATRWASGGDGYVYIIDTGGSGNNKNLYKMRISDGLVEFLQTIVLFGSEGEQAFDEVNGKMYKFIINNLYEYSMQTVNNPSSATFLSAVEALAGNSLSFFTNGDNAYVVGCADGGPLWSFLIGASSHVANRTTNDMRLVCTKQEYNI